MIDPDRFLRGLFEVAVAAADPLLAVPPALSERPSGRVVVVGAGKASAKMAQAVETVWGACEGIVIVPHGAALPTEHIEIVEASHPVPDAAGHEAALRILTLLEDLGEGDFALFLISGGGSALLSAPCAGVTPEQKQTINKALLASGAAIDEMNCVRKHLSSTKGGRLAVAAYPAQSLTLTISDVPGDDPSIIASGPTVPDTTTSADALTIIDRYQIELPDSIRNILKTGASETPDVDHPAFARTTQKMIARPQSALEAAARIAKEQGVTPMILGDAIEGEAREVGKTMAGIARQIVAHGQPLETPCVLLSGGETTVTVRQKPGIGGRNGEFLLGFVTAWDHDRVSALATDTDGIDGFGDNAGAIWTHAVREKAEPLNKRDYLDGHDSYTFFKEAGGLIMTGPTQTNVNDFRAILIL
ncbi:glycerate kinase type-2 family protein [Litoreibacter roseus]|uniref:Glycerate kinase n=1 Tax=Litoreibacter roseus TaxID=2601869 RepID=A0A6N6JEW2_9RHOB|nr:glycerate kinase [Litoreibacter roseus]GFE64891.1 glycerate kinase [Litoreibacter roseus]